MQGGRVVAPRYSGVHKVRGSPISRHCRIQGLGGQGQPYPYPRALYVVGGSLLQGIVGYSWVGGGGLGRALWDMCSPRYCQIEGARGWLPQCIVRYRGWWGGGSSAPEHCGMWVELCFEALWDTGSFLLWRMVGYRGPRGANPGSGYLVVGWKPTPVHYGGCRPLSWLSSFSAMYCGGCHPSPCSFPQCIVGRGALIQHSDIRLALFYKENSLNRKLA